MKAELITSKDIKDLKYIRAYFGENDKTAEQHKYFSILNNLIKKIENDEKQTSLVGGCKKI